MIETIRTLITSIAPANAHVVAVHFPVALLMVAPLLDIACLVFPRRVWMDRAASALYILGTIGAGVAYLSGRREAASLENAAAVVEAAIADHADLALLTLITFSAITILRLLVSWLARFDNRIHLGFFRLAALAAALIAQLLLVLTADRGGALVYRHGVGVERPAASSPTLK